MLVKGATKICPSEKKFDVSKMEFQQTEAVEITLNKVDETEPFTMISVDVNVINCGEPITRQKQEVTVSDATGLATVQLWENNIGMVEEGKSYKLKNFRVVEYENVKQCVGQEVKSSQLNLLKVQLTEMRVVLKKTVPPYAIQELPQCLSWLEMFEVWISH